VVVPIGFAGLSTLVDDISELIDSRMSHSFVLSSSTDIMVSEGKCFFRAPNFESNLFTPTFREQQLD
jgi:hypothetical protein